MIKIECEDCSFHGRRKPTTRTPCPKCSSPNVWQIDADGHRVGRMGPPGATPMFEINDLGQFRVYNVFEMAAFHISKGGYMINREEAGRLAKVLADFAKART